MIAGTVERGDIEPYLFERQFFIPSEIGLPDLQPEELTEDDHIWHEIVEVKETSAEPTVGMNAEELIESFKDAHAREWNWFEVMKRRNFV